MRPIILKLATKISLECGTYTGVTPNDPEYKILDPVLTDEMAEIAMGLRVRHYVTPEEVAKKVKKPLDRVTEVLYELAQLGVCRFAKKDGVDKFNMPIWVPGIMEMMVGNKEMCEKYPVIAECFEEYTRKRIAPLAPFVPVGQGMMRVIPVQGYIKLASQGRFDEALELIRRENPFPAVCGRVCPRFCEEACTRGDVDAPVAIDEVKKFLAQRELDPATRVKPKMLNTTGKPYKNQIAVIGAGPAGLSCAYYLALQGYPVTVFEKQKTLGGMLTMGIPSFRLEKDVVEAEIEILKDLGVEFRTGVEVGKDVTLDGLRKDGYEAFYIAIGAWKSTPIGVPGEKLKGVMAGIDFLRRTNSSRKPAIGENVAVIGGGNVAIDVARSAVRLGAKSVIVVYRRTEAEMPADAEEVAEAKAEGVKFKFLAAPAQIEGKDGKAAALKLQLMELGEPDASGRRKPVPVEGEFETLKAETVIAAIGQSVEWGGLLEGSKVETGRGGTAIADSTTFQTAQPDVFVGGDVMTGPKFVIDAIAAGKEGAISIHRFVQPGQSLTLGRRKKDYAEFDKAGARIYSYDNAPRQKVKNPSAKEQKETFRDLRGTFTEKQVLKETERCLGCGATVVDQAACVGCGVCTTMCKFDAIKLRRVTDAAGEKYEKLLIESGKNVAKRVKNIAVRKISRPAGK